MEPVTLSLLITTLVASGLTFIINVIQSIKENHFQSDCFGGKCCSVTNDFKGQAQQKK